MAWIPRIRALFKREKLTKELEEELEFHLSMREQWNVEQGMPPGQARRDARRHFGNPSLWREQMSEIDLMILPETILQDVRYGARMLWRNPGFTVVAVLALALGIGVNTTFFTAYKALFARSLDARDPGTMVNLALIRHSEDADPRFSYPDYEAYRDHVRSFSGLIAEDVQPLTLSGVAADTGQRGSAVASLVGRLGLLPSGTGASLTEFANTAIVSENYFSVLGIAIVRGRTFDSQDVRELSAAPAVLISENYWQKRFAGDPSILGKTIRLNGAAFTIIGITPHDFVGTSVTAPDFWLPLSLEPLVHPDDNWLRDRENLCCRLFAAPRSGRQHRTGAGRDDSACRPPRAFTTPTPSQANPRPVRSGRALRSLPVQVGQRTEVCDSADHDRRRYGAGDRLRQCRQPATGACRIPPE